MAKTKDIGQRGKVAEGEVQKYLNALSSRVAAFEFERIYDARSAGGKFPKRPGDFAFYRTSVHDGTPKVVVHTLHGLIEVKELEHAYRLPKTRLASLPKLVKRELSGGIIVVLIKNPLTGMWRCPPFAFFRNNQSVTSWDLRLWREHPNLNEALCNHMELR